MREPNSFGHRLGWPGLLALVEPEAKPSHVTKPRVKVLPSFVADSRTRPSDRAANSGPLLFTGQPVYVAYDPAAGPDTSAVSFLRADGALAPFGGPAQAPQSESSRAAPVEPPLACPPIPAGWTKHDGKPVVLPNGLYRLLFRDGFKCNAALPKVMVDFFDWSRAGGKRCCDVVAYKPAQENLLPPVSSADADGWVEHAGNVRPVPAGVRVRMKWSNGCETEAVMGDIPGNGWSCGGLRITHYRVVKP